MVGRVRYAYNRGFWDEWFLLFDDGSQRWISEDEDNLQISRLKKKRLPASRFVKAEPGSHVTIEAERYHVNEKGVAECIGGEGQLPFVVEPGEKTPFLDISHGSKITGSVEFTEAGDVRLYLGKSLDKSEIEINVQGKQYGSEAVEGASKAKFVQASADKPESYNCYACGGTLPAQGAEASVECGYCGTANNPAKASGTCPECKISVAIPGGDAAATVTCPGCHTSFEGSGAVLSTQEASSRPSGALLKVGQRGVVDDIDYVVTGWIFSHGKEDGWAFTSWEYMLYNPDVGYRWLVCSDDHYSIAKPIPPIDEEAATTLKSGFAGDKLSHHGRKYKISGRGSSSIHWVEGQLPYVAKVNDGSEYCDAAKAPYLLSMEKSADEVEYFEARYMQRQEVADSFDLALGEIPVPAEKAAHQSYPISPFRKQALLCMLVFAALNSVAIMNSNSNGTYVQDFAFSHADWKSEVLSSPFAVTQDDSVVRLMVTTQVDNDWVYVDLGLLDDDRRVLHEFGTTIQQYHGVAGGESWREGGRGHTFHMKISKAGNYRVLLLGQAQTYQGKISLEVSQGCTLNEMNWVLLLFCGFWVGIEVFLWMQFKGFFDEN